MTPTAAVRVLIGDTVLTTQFTGLSPPVEKSLDAAYQMVASLAIQWIAFMPDQVKSAINLHVAVMRLKAKKSTYEGIPVASLCILYSQEGSRSALTEYDILRIPPSKRVGAHRSLGTRLAKVDMEADPGPTEPLGQIDLGTILEHEKMGKDDEKNQMMSICN